MESGTLNGILSALGSKGQPKMPLTLPIISLPVRGSRKTGVTLKVQSVGFPAQLTKSPWRKMEAVSSLRQTLGVSTH